MAPTSLKRSYGIMSGSDREIEFDCNWAIDDFREKYDPDPRDDNWDDFPKPYFNDNPDMAERELVILYNILETEDSHRMAEYLDSKLANMQEWPD